MKKYLHITILLWSSIVYSQDTIRQFDPNNSDRLIKEYVVDNNTQKLNGFYKEYDEIGELKSHAEYKNGLLWNIFLVKDSNNNIISDFGTFKNGTGTLKEFKGKNIIKSISEYKNGLLNGSSIKYYDNGEISMKGNYYQISVIYGQLRSLLTENSKKLTPLLFEVAKSLNSELEIFHIPDTFEKELPHLTEGMIFRMFSTSPSIDKLLPRHNRIKMSDYLKIDLLTYKERKFTVKKIIEELANKYGGAHYSKVTHKYLSEVLSFGLNSQPMLDNFVYQLSELTLNLGINLLKKITDIEFYINIYLTEKKVAGEIFIFDYQLPNNQNRFALILNQGKLHFLIVDSIGLSRLIIAESLLEYDKVHLINISIETTKNYKSQIQIFIDENLVAEHITEFPLLTINEINNFDAYYNKQKSGEDQEYEFGLGELAIYRRTFNTLEKCKIYNYFLKQKHEDVLWIEKKVFGQSPSGKSNIIFNKKIMRRKI